MQGFNMGRYVPPDLEGTISGNKLHHKHPLGARASKLSKPGGGLIVRFEMPFPIWCQTCPKPTIIGQGVRFNAEKRRVGSYHTSAIWSFRFRHVECGGSIEMRTDPQNTAYVVVAGAAKRDTGSSEEGTAAGGGPGGSGDMVIMTDQEREALRKNAFASLEKTIEDREQLKLATERIDNLADASFRHWDDPYTQNQKLRKAFRAGRKERESLAAAAENLKDRMSLGIELLPETKEDAIRASLVDFGLQAHDGDSILDKALSKPLFDTKVPHKASLQQNQKHKDNNNNHNKNKLHQRPSKTVIVGLGGKQLKAEKEASRKRQDIVSTLLSNTRAAQDPFLNNTRVATATSAAATSETRPASKLLTGLKRKRSLPSFPTPTQSTDVAEAVPVQKSTSSRGLVQYDSD